MKLIISNKGSGYEVLDKATSKKMYTLKKKSFAPGVYLLCDKNNYKLYTFTQLKTINLPSFSVSHDNDEIIKFVCKSNTGELVLSAIGYDINGNPFNYTASSEDKFHFNITQDGQLLGKIEVIFTLSNTLQYELEFDDERYDDYISLFAIAVDLSYSQIYKS